MPYNLCLSQFFFFFIYIYQLLIYNLLIFFSEKYEQLSSIEVLNTTFNNTIIECDDPYVKIHPERKQMKNADPRIGVCLFQYLSILNIKTLNFTDLSHEFKS